MCLLLLNKQLGIIYNSGKQALCADVFTMQI
jgi:hypothetical protein